MTKLKTQRSKVKSGKLWIAVLSVLLAVLAIQLIASNALAGKGGELGELEKKVSSLSYQNQLLKSELAQKSSLSLIASQSAELGLAKPESIIYAELSQPVAALPQ
ncbi:MAG: hypothetical protein Q7S60_00610 [bacterium]|nr:hypothetical protein [bacterium]